MNIIMHRMYLNELYASVKNIMSAVEKYLRWNNSIFLKNFMENLFDYYHHRSSFDYEILVFCLFFSTCSERLTKFSFWDYLGGLYFTTMQKTLFWCIYMWCWWRVFDMWRFWATDTPWKWIRHHCSSKTETKNYLNIKKRN